MKRALFLVGGWVRGCRSYGRVILPLVTLSLWTHSVLGQGAVVFNTKTGAAANTTAAPGAVWAPVYLPEPSDPYTQKFGNTATGIPAGTQTYSGGYVIGTGYTCQLWGGAVSASDDQLSLLATTTFRTQTSTAFAGTITAPASYPTVPGVPGGSQARLQLRVWDNQGGTITSWAAALASADLRLGASRSFVTTWPLVLPPGSPNTMQGLGSFSLAINPGVPAHAPPVVSNVRASQRSGTKLVDITYDVSAAGNVDIALEVSSDGGVTYTVPAASFMGDYGANRTVGTGKRITWNAGADWPSQFSSQCRVRLTATDTTPPNLVLIPAGSFTMGDTFNEGYSDERPTHSVSVSAFYMDKYEVTKELWDAVKSYNGGNGYTYDNPGAGKAANHPVHTVNWYDCVKWCNARSQKDGRTPCYYTDAGLTAIYKTGQVAPFVKWSANGYRLPTEAEWEKAARGGASGRRFPWGDTITHSQANYYSSTSHAYDTSPTRGYHPTYAVGNSPYTSPVGSFPASGGLHDMAGNVWEWCWDWYDGGGYGNAGATQSDTRGPAGPLSNRMLRGGAWYSGANYARCAYRGSSAPASAGNVFGFRCVRGL